MNPRDADPLTVEYELPPADPRLMGTEYGPVKPRRSGCLASLLAIVAVVVLIAAPRPAQPVIPADDLDSATRGVSAPTSSGNLAGRTEALSDRVVVPPATSREDTGGASIDPGSPSSGGLVGSAPSVSAPGRVTEPPAEPQSPSAGTTRTGWATWCAPTPKHCQSWGGDAMLGAVPSFRWGDEPYTVQVCSFEGKTNCVLVTVVSYCACGDRKGEPTVIDLSPRAFRSLAPQSLGIVRVTVEGIRPKSKRPRITLPPTDMAEHGIGGTE